MTKNDGEKLETLRFSRLNECNVNLIPICNLSSHLVLQSRCSEAALSPRHMVHFGTTSWFEHGLKMALCRFIYGVIKEKLCYQRMLHYNTYLLMTF